MKKRILILIGDWPDHIIVDLKLFKLIEEKFKIKIKKENDFTYHSKLNNKEIIFQFCFGSQENKFRKEREVQWGKKLPPSIQSIAKSNKKIHEIYYLGLCGLLNGKVNNVYLPNSFKKITFNEYYISSQTSFKISKPIKCKNSLSNKMQGVECTGLTSNQVLLLKYMKNKDPQTLRNLGTNLSNVANIVEMEGYGIAKYFGKNHALGLAYLGTDSPIRKAYVLGKEMEGVDWKKFNDMVIEVIKSIV